MGRKHEQDFRLVRHLERIPIRTFIAERSFQLMSRKSVECKVKEVRGFYVGGDLARGKDRMMKLVKGSLCFCASSYILVHRPVTLKFFIKFVSEMSFGNATSTGNPTFVSQLCAHCLISM